MREFYRASSGFVMRLDTLVWTGIDSTPKYDLDSRKFRLVYKVLPSTDLNWMTGLTIICRAMGVVRRLSTWRATYVKT